MKNIFSSISNPALITGMLLLSGAIGTVCYEWAAFNSNAQNADLRQTVRQQQQRINNLVDTILVLKLSQKDTITSMQEPHGFPVKIK